MISIVHDFSDVDLGMDLFMDVSPKLSKRRKSQELQWRIRRLEINPFCHANLFPSNALALLFAFYAHIEIVGECLVVK